MTDAETAAHLRRWCTEVHAAFEWPTDVCGYEQHIRFVEHRNRNWHGDGRDEWIAFVLAYAAALDAADAGEGKGDT